MGRIADISWPKKILAVSSIYIVGLLTVGAVGGYTIYAQNRATGDALKVSQARADAAGKAQAAILIMGKAQAELISASGLEDRRGAAVLAIQASSTLDESIQRLQQTLVGSEKVAELARLLQEIGPAKMYVIKAVRENNDSRARLKVRDMQGAMARVEMISGELAQEESNKLTVAVANQKDRAKSTLWVLGVLVGCGGCGQPAGRSGTASAGVGAHPGKKGGGRGVASKEPIPGTHESRDPDAHEWRHRDDRTGALDRTYAGAERVPDHGEVLGGLLAEPH